MSLVGRDRAIPCSCSHKKMPRASKRCNPLCGLQSLMVSANLPTTETTSLQLEYLQVVPYLLENAPLWKAMLSVTRCTRLQISEAWQTRWNTQWKVV